MTWDLGVLSRKDLRVQSLHCLSSERRHFHDNLVEDATGTPNVTSVIVRLVFPDLRAGVVRGSRLRAHHTGLDDATDVQIAQLDHSVFGHENIRTLDVSVADSEIMKCFESSDDLNEVVPDLLLCEACVGFLVILDALQQVSTICILHYDTETVRLVLHESFFIANDVDVINRSENSNFIQSVLFFLR